MALLGHGGEHDEDEVVDEVGEVDVDVDVDDDDDDDDEDEDEEDEKHFSFDRRSASTSDAS